MNAHYRGDAFTIVRAASGFRGSPAERLVFVFQCYLDDSGTSGMPIITLGGFVAHMSQWERIEPLVDEVMNRHGVRVFHAKEFHDTHPPFKNWSKNKKLNFADEVFKAARGAMQGISIALEKSSFEAEKKENRKAFGSMSVLGGCFGAIMFKLITHAQLAPMIKREGISFLLESGNQHNAGIEKRFHEHSKMPVFEGALRSISFVGKDSCRAVQLADFFVFYSRRKLRNQYRFKGKLLLPPCPYLAIMENYGPVHQDMGSGKIKSTGAVLDKDLNSLDDLFVLTRKDHF